MSSFDPELITVPVFRRLRGYALDPSLSTQMDTAMVNEIVFKVRWEPVDAGPIGEYLEVIDFDPASGGYYAPLALDHQHLLAQDGLPPSEGSPQFHQQMVYAVAMTTIDNFERALGRMAIWAPHRGQSEGARDQFVDRLRIYPHALRQANAFYSPTKKALLFGYFPAPERNAPGPDAASHLPGGWVFTCLSHDVIAHETVHALLDGMHRRYIEPTNVDTLAFHEAFADIVALFQHFTFPEVLRHQIATTRGDLRSENMLGKLAQQFGRAMGKHSALRDAIGEVVAGRWRPKRPDPQALASTFEPHERGSILVAAVFDAFQAIYERRASDLYRIATSGSGVLPEGHLHPDLVNRLAAEAAKSAKHVLRMCIRALDYCPPVDVTFGDFLRAIITADVDLVRDDDLSYRVAFIEAFRRRGIYPRDVRTLSVDSLRWPDSGRGHEADRVGRLAALIDDKLKELRDDARTRKVYFERSQRLAEDLRNMIRASDFVRHELEQLIRRHVVMSSPHPEIENDRSDLPQFEVHAVRPAHRVGPDGDVVNHAVVVIAQRRKVRLDPADPASPPLTFRGGVTLIFNLATFTLQYAIGKGILDDDRLHQQRELLSTGRVGSAWNTYFGAPHLGLAAEPFAMLHRSDEELAP